MQGLNIQSFYLFALCTLSIAIVEIGVIIAAKPIIAIIIESVIFSPPYFVCIPTNPVI